MVDMEWTQQEEQIIKDNHCKITLAQIQKLLPGRNYYALRSKTQRMGLYRDKSLVKLHIKNKHNEEYWKIPTLINSYFGGILAGDGCIHIDKSNTYNLRYKISRKDESLMDILIGELSFTGKKSYGTSKSPHSENISQMCYFSISCFHKNAEYLKNHFNIIPLKTKRLGPTNLTDPLLNFAYLIGNIDSDGSIEFVKKGKYSKYLYLGVNSSSKSIVDWFKNLLDTYFPPNPNNPAMVRLHKKDNYYRFYIGGVRAMQIFDFLREFPVPKLARKWEQPEILEAINKRKSINPHLFKKPLNILDFNNQTNYNKDMSNEEKPMLQTSGKENLVTPRTLAQVWGDTGLSKYNTLDVEEYKAYINDLNKTDLQAHAIRIGLAPISERYRLTEALIREFKTYANQFVPSEQLKPAPEKEISPEVAKILSEGR